MFKAFQRFVFVLLLFFLTSLFLPKNTSAVFCQCCTSLTGGTCISKDCSASNQGTCCTSNKGDSCGKDTDGDGIPQQLACPGTEPYVTGCESTGGGGGSTPAPTATPKPTQSPSAFECWQACSTTSQCRSPLVCGTASDNTKRCIYPNYPADQTCRQLPVCNSVCTTSDACGRINHIIRLVNKPNSATQTYMPMDVLLEDSLRYEENSSRFIYTGVWTKSTFLASHSGGFEVYTAAVGASVQFNTSSKKVTYIAQKAPNLGSMEIWVDGILSQTVNRYSSVYTASQPLDIVTEPVDNGYLCYNDTSVTPNQQICRLGSDPTNPACLTCQGFVRAVSSTSAPKFGDQVSYTARAVSSTGAGGRKVIYEGKCSVSRNSVTLRSFDLVATSELTFAPFKITDAGVVYQCLFRDCYLDSANNKLCSAWGL